jgi:hypothetical protein
MAVILIFLIVQDELLQLLDRRLELDLVRMGKACNEELVLDGLALGRRLSHYSKIIYAPIPPINISTPF